MNGSLDRLWVTEASSFGVSAVHPHNPRLQRPALRAAAEPERSPSTLLMKRFRVLAFALDTRAALLQQEILPEWEETVRARWGDNKKRVRTSLVRAFGESSADQQLQDFVDLGPKPFSTLAFHNRFSSQVRVACAVGAYCPALTGACALGERILNHLVIRLRDHFRSSDQYKRVHRKDSSDRWAVPLDALASWGVLFPDALEAFGTLEVVRNRAIHFRPETDTTDRAMALETIGLTDRIVAAQFPVMGLQPWFIPDVAGESFIKREWDAHPFIREVYVPNCSYVGPHHAIVQHFPDVIVRALVDYPDDEITDAEFVALRAAGTPAGK